MLSRQQLIMMVLLIGLIVFYGVSNRLEEKREEKEAQEKRLYADIKAEDISAIAVEVKEKSTRLELERRQKRWFRGDTLLSSDKVDRLAEDLAQLSRKEDVLETPAEKQLADFGLDNPAYLLTFTVAGKEHHLRVGKRTPTGDQFYVQTEAAAPVVTVDATFGEVLEKKPEELRELSPLPVAPAEVQRLELQPAGSEKIVIVGEREKTDDEEEKGLMQYRLLEPIEAAADRQAVTDYLWDWHGLEAGRFLTADDKVEWAEPSLTLKTVSEDGVEAGFEAGQAVEVKPTMRYLRRLAPEEAMVVDLEKKPDLLKPTAHQFRQRHLLVAEVDKVTRVEGVVGDTQVAGQKKGENWTISKPDPVSEGASLADLLWKIKDLKWEENAPAGSDLGESRGSFEFFDEEGNSLGKFQLGAVQNGKTLVQLGEEKEFFLVSGDIVEDLSAVVAGLQPKNPAESPTPESTP